MCNPAQADGRTKMIFHFLVLICFTLAAVEFRDPIMIFGEGGEGTIMRGALQYADAGSVLFAASVVNGTSVPIVLLRVPVHVDPKAASRVPLDLQGLPLYAFPSVSRFSGADVRLDCPVSPTYGCSLAFEGQNVDPSVGSKFVFRLQLQQDHAPWDRLDADAVRYRDSRLLMTFADPTTDSSDGFYSTVVIPDFPPAPSMYITLPTPPIARYHGDCRPDLSIAQTRIRSSYFGGTSASPSLFPLTATWAWNIGDGNQSLALLSTANTTCFTSDVPLPFAAAVVRPGPGSSGLDAAIAALLGFELVCGLGSDLVSVDCLFFHSRNGLLGHVAVKFASPYKDGRTSAGLPPVSQFTATAFTNGTVPMSGGCWVAWNAVSSSFLILIQPVQQRAKLWELVPSSPLDFVAVGSAPADSVPWAPIFGLATYDRSFAYIQGNRLIQGCFGACPPIKGGGIGYSIPAVGDSETRVDSADSTSFEADVVSSQASVAGGPKGPSGPPDITVIILAAALAAAVVIILLGVVLWRRRIRRARARRNTAGVSTRMRRGTRRSRGGSRPKTRPRSLRSGRSTNPADGAVGFSEYDRVIVPSEAAGGDPKTVYGVAPGLSETGSVARRAGEYTSIGNRQVTGSDYDSPLSPFGAGGGDNDDVFSVYDSPQSPLVDHEYGSVRAPGGAEPIYLSPKFKETALISHQYTTADVQHGQADGYDSVSSFSRPPVPVDYQTGAVLKLQDGQGKMKSVYQSSISSPPAPAVNYQSGDALKLGSGVGKSKYDSFPANKQ